MRRFAWVVLAVLSISLSLGAMVGCGSKSTSSTGLPTPASVTLSPVNSSVDLGATLQFTPTVRPALTAPVTYTSSNPSVLSFVPTAAGVACAGRWDPAGQVCSPTSVGIALVTATVNGVSSPPVKVYVHQHLDKITLSVLTQLTPIPKGNCVTLGTGPSVLNYLDLQAQAFSNGVDVTNTVGSFTFTPTNSAVARATLNDPELSNNNGNQVTQARITAVAPGITQIYATVSGVNSLPVVIGGNSYFETCRVQSINLQVGNAATNTSFTSSGAGVAVTATAVDRLGFTLTNPPITWTSLSPAIGTVSPAGIVGFNKSPGTVGIVASCTPPGCNVSTPGVVPIEPVYSSTLSPAGGTEYVGTPIIGTLTGSAVSTTAFATTTQCDTAAGIPITGCQPLVYPITTSNNAVGSSVTLPSSPNSFVFAPGGTKAFLGSSAGLMVFNTTTVSQFNNIPGKVLAVSLDGNRVIVSDTNSTPNQVYIVDASTTSASVTSSLFISGAIAAAFSPEGLKAFIVGKASASDPASGDTLYVYSSLLPLATVHLTGSANAVAPYANGALAYLSGGQPNAVTMLNTCDTNYGVAASITVPRLPTMFQALPDGVHAIGFDPPGVDVFAVKAVAPTPASLSQPSSTTCPFTVTPPDPPEQEFTFANLGQGDFTPLKIIIASDNSKAYILASNLSSVFVYSFGVGSVSAIPLTGGPVPLDASLTSDGSLLYVGTSDGSVHVLSTVSGGDLQQITFTNNNATNKGSLCSNIPQTCNPDLIAVQPK